MLKRHVEQVKENNKISEVEIGIKKQWSKCKAKKNETRAVANLDISFIAFLFFDP